MAVKLAGNDIPVLPGKPARTKDFRKQCREGGNRRDGVITRFFIYPRNNRRGNVNGRTPGFAR